jgi:hypothetical protein
MSLKKRHENRRKEQYWIDTVGKIHRYKGKDIEDVVSIHGTIARELYPDSNRPTDVLMNLGWIMMGSTVYSHPIIHKEPTQSQINKLDKLNEYKRLCILENDFYVNYDKTQK